MFIPPRHLQSQFRAGASSASPVRLRASHLHIDGELAQTVFGDCENAYVVYYPGRQLLLIAPVTDEDFKKLHQVQQHMVKDRNLQGDKSIALHELLIDQQLREEDRDLPHELQAGLGVLKVTL